MAKGTREKIINTAWKLFYEKGFGETTINDILREADISKGTFYYYFRSKDGYTTGGFTYTNPENRRYFAKRNRIGDIRDIYVNPDDPEDIYVNRFHRRNIVYVLFVIVGVILAARFFVGI